MDIKMFGFKKKNNQNINNQDGNYKINKNIQFVINVFNDLIDNQFKCRRKDLVDNGAIFYFNSQNGTKFDWEKNDHISTLATIYPNGTEAVKVLIYKDGLMQVYYYKKGSKQPDATLNSQVSIETAKTIAILLFSISDRKGLFDKRLEKLDISYEITEDDINKFEDEDFIAD